MDNQKILSEIMDHIKAVMDEQKLSQDHVAKLCEQKGSKVSQATISNIFKHPSAAKVSTLLNICDGLDLNLFAIFRDVNNSLMSAEGNNLIYSIKHPAFNGYLDPMYVYFIETSSNHSSRLLHGELTLDDFYHTNECIARLRIDTNDLDEYGNHKYKEYEGNVIINQNEAIYFHLVSNKLGDVWSLIFNHGNLNQNSLACSLGTAVTLSSGKNTRYPTMHFVCLSKTKLDPAGEEIIKQRLLIRNKEIVISDEKLSEFLKQEDIDPTFRESLELCTRRQAAKAYIIPLSSLSSYISDPKIAYDMTLRLLQYSACETAYQILPNSDKKLFSALQ